MSKEVELQATGGRNRSGSGTAAATAPIESVIAIGDLADKTAVAPAPKKKKNPRLNQLTGMRAFASLWIVLGHYSPGPEYPFARILKRAWVGVSFFVFLSGFVTHYAYYNRTYTEWEQIRQFYFRRIGRVLASYYISYGCVAIAFLAINGIEEDAHEGRGWYMYVLVSEPPPTPVISLACSTLLCRSDENVHLLLYHHRNYKNFAVSFTTSTAVPPPSPFAAATVPPPFNFDSPSVTLPGCSHDHQCEPVRLRSAFQPQRLDHLFASLCVAVLPLHSILAETQRAPFLGHLTSRRCHVLL
jgi:hypothetical protein